MADAGKTKALYQTDSTLQTHPTTITSLTPLSSLPPPTQSLFKAPDSGTPYILTTPATIFHAQGGGQPSDTGSITPRLPSSSSTTATKEDQPTFHVHQVRKSNTSILHLGTFTAPESTFSTGEEVLQTVDWEPRTLHSRLHTAGHVLGLAIRALSSADENVLPADLKEVKASHYPGAAFVEFAGLIPGDKKAAMQAKVDELVARDLAVSVHFWSEDEARERCGAGVLEGVKGGGEDGEGVRVVEVGGVGAYPCGGTHVRSLKELGRVVVRNVKRQKGVSKVSYEVVDA